MGIVDRNSERAKRILRVAQARREKRMMVLARSKGKRIVSYRRGGIAGRETNDDRGRVQSRVRVFLGSGDQVSLLCEGDGKMPGRLKGLQQPLRSCSPGIHGLGLGNQRLHVHSFLPSIAGTIKDSRLSSGQRQVFGIICQKPTRKALQVRVSLLPARHRATGTHNGSVAP